jgi:hypothetical protein
MYTFKISNFKSNNSLITEDFLIKELDAMRYYDEIVSGDAWFGNENYDINVLSGENSGADNNYWKGCVCNIFNQLTEDEVAWFDIEIFKDGVQLFPE